MNKYGNERCTGLGGIPFDSKAERAHAYWLESERQAGRIEAWEHHSQRASYKLEVNGKLITTHAVDFTVYYPDGRIEVHEVKGGKATQTDGFRIRKKLFEALNPEIRYVVEEYGYKRGQPIRRNKWRSK